MDELDLDLGIVNAFLQSVMLHIRVDSCLAVSMSHFALFKHMKFAGDSVEGIDWPEAVPSSQRYKLICADLPLGLNRVPFEIGSKILKIRRNWSEIVKCLRLLDADGTAVCLVEPLAFGTADGQVFETALESEGYFVNAIFNAPDNLIKPRAQITPTFVLLTRKPAERIFLAELQSVTQASDVVNNYYQDQQQRDLRGGLLVLPNTFRGFHGIKIRSQIEKLETQYKQYEECTIGELAVEINHAKSGDNYDELQNSIYIPKIGTSSVVSSVEELTLKHHNYYQVVLQERVINRYLAAFFRSAIGKLILSSLTSTTYIPHINKRDIESAPVALPGIDDQESIVTTQSKLRSLKVAIDQFGSELAVNPISSEDILNQLDSMLDVIGRLTDSDRVRSLIREGESKFVEYKETLSLDVRKQTKEKTIETSSLKTIAAFINTDGGTLLIGIHDNGSVTGLDSEIEKFHKNIDKLLLHFKNLLKRSIGEEFYPFIDYRPIQVDGKTVLLVECKAGLSPCYIDKLDFYVRTNPATDKLDGPRLVEYIRNHFT